MKELIALTTSRQCCSPSLLPNFPTDRLDALLSRVPQSLEVAPKVNHLCHQLRGPDNGADGTISLPRHIDDTERI